MLARWNPFHITAATVAWWAGLGAATLHEPIAAIRRAARLPEGESSFSVMYDGGAFVLKVFERGEAVWSGSASGLAVILLAAAPPFLLVMAWLWARGRERRRLELLASGADARESLGAGDQPIPYPRRAAEPHDLHDGADRR